MNDEFISIIKKVISDRGKSRDTLQGQFLSGHFAIAIVLQEPL
jgi:hypothetical protein